MSVALSEEMGEWNQQLAGRGGERGEMEKMMLK